MIRLRTVLRYTFIAGTTGALVGAAYSKDWKISNIGVVRLGRAALTVGAIAADYKISLHGCDDNSDDSLDRWSKVHTKSAERLLKLAIVNGGVFIKVGQHIATLEYLVPKEYCDVLKVLHSGAPKVDVEVVRRTIRQDLGRDVDELFEEFDPEPIGAASLAQVHRAKLHGGQQVAVKVQHPNVRAHSLVDMATMDLLVRSVSKIFPDFSFLWLAEEMKINLPMELDFLHETQNCERVKKMFSHFPWLKVPDIFSELCTKRVLTMEFVEGGCVNDVNFIKKNNLNTRTISSRLGSLFSEMIFVEGYVHCDPHPGNILINPTGDGDFQVVLLDHGLYLNLNDKFRNDYSRLWLAILNRDTDNIKKYGMELGAGDLFPILACVLAAKTWNSISKGIISDTTKTVNEDKELKKYAQQLIPQLVTILSNVPREMYLLLKTNDLLRGIDSTLGTRGQKSSFFTMSRCCILSVYDRKISQSRRFFERIFYRIVKSWLLLKLSAYQLYLRFASSNYS